MVVISLDGKVGCIDLRSPTCGRGGGGGLVMVNSVHGLRLVSVGVTGGGESALGVFFLETADYAEERVI